MRTTKEISVEDPTNTETDPAGLVSVIVPVYNAEKYLCRCIDSIICQTYCDIEILLIDDGSTDGSGEICDAYSNYDNRIKVIHIKNSGPAAARNTGIEHSQGTFIFFVDADDSIEKNAIGLLMELYQQTKADIIIGDFKRINNGSVEERGDISFSSSTLLTKNDLMTYARSYLKRPNKYLLFAFIWGRLFKASIIKDHHISFNTDLQTFEDHAFNFDYLNHVKEVFFLKYIIYNYTVYDDYSSTTMAITENPERIFGFKRSLSNIKNFLKNHITGDRMREEIGHTNVFLTIVQLVRTCGQLNDNNKEKIIRFIHETVDDSNLRLDLQYYSPSKGESKLLPLLMRYRLILPIVWLCRYKARKRYKKAREVI